MPCRYVRYMVVRTSAGMKVVIKYQFTHSGWSLLEMELELETV